MLTNWTHLNYPSTKCETLTEFLLKFCLNPLKLSTEQSAFTVNNNKQSETQRIINTSDRYVYSSWILMRWTNINLIWRYDMPSLAWNRLDYPKTILPILAKLHHAWITPTKKGSLIFRLTCKFICMQIIKTIQQYLLQILGGVFRTLPNI